MEELSVKTLKFEPAIVKFNYDELSKTLERNLEKYIRLTFTEDNLADGKKTVAELRKGKKAVDEYRKTTKKKLTQSVTAFESQCKDLNNQFDEVLNPLISQLDDFEIKRKNKKYEEIRFFIDMITTDYHLKNEFASELVTSDEYLNKGITMKFIEDELRLKAELLKARQDTFHANKDRITNAVELANNRYDVSLTDAAYVRLLDYKEVGEIKEQILLDAQVEVRKRETQTKQLEEQAKKVKEPKQETPFDIVEPVKKEPIFYEVYKVNGTEPQLTLIESFMKENGIDFEIQ